MVPRPRPASNPTPNMAAAAQPSNGAPGFPSGDNWQRRRCRGESHIPRTSPRPHGGVPRERRRRSGPGPGRKPATRTPTVVRPFGASFERSRCSVAGSPPAAIGPAAQIAASKTGRKPGEFYAALWDMIGRTKTAVGQTRALQFWLVALIPGCSSKDWNTRSGAGRFPRDLRRGLPLPAALGLKSAGRRLSCSERRSERRCRCCEGSWRTPSGASPAR